MNKKGYIDWAELFLKMILIVITIVLVGLIVGIIYSIWFEFTHECVEYTIRCYDKYLYYNAATKTMLTNYKQVDCGGSFDREKEECVRWI